MVFLFQPLSKYLKMTRDDWKVVAAAGAQVQEREESNNDPSNTTLLVEGLASFNTESQLKAVLATFGDLRYLKFHEDERYAVVEFANRLLYFEVHHEVLFVVFHVVLLFIVSLM